MLNRVIGQTRFRGCTSTCCASWDWDTAPSWSVCFPRCYKQPLTDRLASFDQRCAFRGSMCRTQISAAATALPVPLIRRQSRHHPGGAVEKPGSLARIGAAVLSRAYVDETGESMALFSPISFPAKGVARRDHCAAEIAGPTIAAPGGSAGPTCASCALACQGLAAHKDVSGRVPAGCGAEQADQMVP